MEIFHEVFKPLLIVIMAPCHLKCHLTIVWIEILHWRKNMKNYGLWISCMIFVFSFFFTYISFFAVIVNLNLNSLLIKIMFHHQFKGFHFLCILVFQESFYKTYIAFICHHFYFCYGGFAFLTTIPSVLMSACWYNCGVPTSIDDEVTLINLSDLLFDVLLLGVFRICVLELWPI